MSAQWQKVDLLDRLSVHDEYWDVEDEDGRTGIAMYSCGELVSIEVDTFSATDGLAHEIWSAAQLMPHEGIADGVYRVSELLKRNKS